MVTAMTNEKTLLLIVNPCAGQRKAQKGLADIIDVFNRANFRVLTYLTAAPGDCERAVLRYADDADLVVCCGGDGTFNEAASGILKSGKKLPIGYIPAGSTNDFAASLRLSSDLRQAARDIVEGNTISLDMGLFCDRYFSYVASFGAFTKTSYTTPQSIKNLLGHAAYVLNGIQELSQLRTHVLRFELADGTVIEDSFIFGAITNSTSVGGILTLADHAVDLSDGIFELLLIRMPKDLVELADCVRAIQKHTYDCNMLTFCKSSQFHITAPAALDWTLDGEMETGHPQIEIRCIHKAIDLIRSNATPLLKA